jgi:acetyltransferase-like isoleucine patch superfamily enzyme
MSNMLKFIKGVWNRRKTKISPLAILNEVTYDKTTAIKALAKLERASVGKCTYIGTLTAAYDCRIGKFCSIARECYIGGASHPVDWVSTSPCFHIKNNATGVCYSENHYKWNDKTVIGNDVWLGIRTIVRGGLLLEMGL